MPTRAESAARRKQNSDAVQGGASFAEVATRFQVSQALVNAACVEHGIAYIRRDRAKVLREKIAAFVRGGGTKPAAAAHFGVSLDNVLKACHVAGIRRAAYVMPAGSYVILARLINTDDAVSKIAADCRVQPQAVTSIAGKARKAGIKLHPNRRKKQSN